MSELEKALEGLKKKVYPAAGQPTKPVPQLSQDEAEALRAPRYGSPAKKPRMSRAEFGAMIHDLKTRPPEED